MNIYFKILNGKIVSYSQGDLVQNNFDGLIEAGDITDISGLIDGAYHSTSTVTKETIEKILLEP